MMKMTKMRMKKNLKVHFKKNLKNLNQYLCLFKDAELIEYTGAWNRLNFGTNLHETKSNNIVLAELKDVKVVPNNNSSDLILSSPAKNCPSLCTYCYVTRHTLHNSPLTIFTNTDDFLKVLKNHVSSLPFKQEPNQQGDKWVYEISCDTDIGNTYHLIQWKPLLDFFKDNEKASCTMASKTFNSKLCEYPATRNIRIRMSLSPQWCIDSMEKKTSPLKTRIKAIQKYYDAGFEVHANISPLFIYEEEAFIKDYSDLFNMLKDNLSEECINQLALEVIVLTTTSKQHCMNVELGNDETFTWNPELQESKVSKTYGSEAIRFKVNYKQKYLDLLEAVNNTTINVPIRYIF